MKRCVNCFLEYDEQYDVCPHCGYYKGKAPEELNHLFAETVLEGRYIIGKVLGFGGFGITYKAWDMKLETVVAIKEYYPSGLVNRVPGEKEIILFAGNKRKEYQYGLERFLDEAKNTAKFSSHKNIVSVFEYFQENNTAYIVMEYLDGTPLSTFLKKNQMDTQSCLDIVSAVASALKELHQNSIIHRDVSPDNIFLCLNGDVKLIDFGAARFSANEESQRTIILKPGFAPPEQYEKVSKQGPWTDIYALGATLYLMLTGEKPEESTDRKTKDTLKSPREINPEISENISNTVMKAMALELSLRFSKMEDFEKALSGEKKVTTLAKEKRRRKRKLITSIVAATLIVGVSTTIFAVQYLAQKEAETLPKANISICYVQDDIENDAKGKALTAIANEFMNSFPEVKIELIGKDKSDYVKEVEKANKATIFESTSLSKKQLEDKSLDISKVFMLSNVSKCELLKESEKIFSEEGRMPIGFNAPVIYCNKTVTDFKKSTVNDVNQLLKAIGESDGIAVDQDVIDAVSNMFGKNIKSEKKIKVVDDAEDFIEGKYAFYISESNEFSEIQSKLPAQYSIIAFGTKEVPITYSDYYSVHQGLTKDEEKVALAFLNFMMSDYAQDYYYIQNWTGYLPLNQNVLGVVENVYDDFDGFFTDISNYVYKK